MKGIKFLQTKVKSNPHNTTKSVQFLEKFESLIQAKSSYTVATFFVILTMSVKNQAYFDLQLMQAAEL